MDEQLQKYLMEKAQQEYEARQVSQGAGLMSGFGQVLQGRPVDTEWIDKRNKLAYDETLGRLKLDRADDEKVRQFNESLAQKEKQSLREDARTRELAQLRARELGLEKTKTENAKKDALEFRKEQAARLSDKQVESVNEFDDSLNKMQDALSQLGNKTEWVGSVDARIPDMFVGNDQVAFRSAVGRMEDAYRKLITGAGASNKELSRLASRLPSTTDTYKDFVSKAKNFVSEVQKAKSTHLSNFEKQGKNVEAWKVPQAPETKIVNGKTYIKVHGGWQEQ